MLGRRGSRQDAQEATDEYFSPDTVALSTIEKDVVFAVEVRSTKRSCTERTCPKGKPGNLLLSRRRQRY